MARPSGLKRQARRCAFVPGISFSRPARCHRHLTLPFGGNVISSTELLSLPEIPARLVIVGAGYIGLELGIAFAKLGSEVTVVEADERILPRWDAALTRPVAQETRRTEGQRHHLGATREG